MVEGVNMKVTSLFYISGFCSFLALGNTCGPSEYKTSDGECCPMCSIGSMVLYDCIGSFSTTCKPCIPGTFISEPSGLHKCFPCKHCDERTKTSDTECENCPFGFYSSSGLNCTKWTDCNARNEIQSEDGSHVKDVKCVQKRKRYCLVALCPPVICAAVLAALYRRSCSEDQTVNNGDKICRLTIEETNFRPVMSGPTPEENNEKPTDDT
ncbi:tumor necrosis factor receptor superfamily member 5-like isoform X3 [Megalobrama amblycephala]|uniref:tumor necrosis factor receptor superfamily member 5-like isoform X3 n=1 Tax=Megalobrama amblycephala TaxID=75352 RepID=UPI0020145253|nr:tumor necrosis factor receptor superfamily member 5-like isoform X3 [Megalobrama amblycephala]